MKTVKGCKHKPRCVAGTAGALVKHHPSKELRKDVYEYGKRVMKAAAEVRGTMSIAKPEKKTPREWAREWLVRADMAGAEASPSEVVEVIVTEAVAYERERCAKIAEAEEPAADLDGCTCGKTIADKIREG
jgi:hypothetical protein